MLDVQVHFSVRIFTIFVYEHGQFLAANLHELLPAEEYVHYFVACQQCILRSKSPHDPISRLQADPSHSQS
jgi:hypothetical protein